MAPCVVSANACTRCLLGCGARAQRRAAGLRLAHWDGPRELIRIFTR
jgi:hypothetical protein